MNSLAQSPVFAALLILAGSGAAAAFVTALSQRKNIVANEAKTKAEASEILSKTALEQNQVMAQQLGEVRQSLRTHREWDKKMVKLARDLGVEIDDPPELWL